MARRRLHKDAGKRQRRNIMIVSLSLLLFLCVGYAAYNTNISINAKGNVKKTKGRTISKK